MKNIELRLEHGIAVLTTSRLLVYLCAPYIIQHQ